MRLGALHSESHNQPHAQLDGFKSRALLPQTPAQRHLYTTEWHRLEDAGAPGAKVLVLGRHALAVELEQHQQREERAQPVVVGVRERVGAQVELAEPAWPRQQWCPTA